MRSVAELCIDLDDDTGHRCVDVRHRLGRLDLAERAPGFQRRSRLGQLDEHHVAEGVLGEVGDAHPDPSVLEAGPLVVLGVPAVVGDVHECAASGGCP